MIPPKKQRLTSASPAPQSGSCSPACARASAPTLTHLHRPLLPPHTAVSPTLQRSSRVVHPPATTAQLWHLQQKSLPCPPSSPLPPRLPVSPELVPAPPKPHLPGHLQLPAVRSDVHAQPPASWAHNGEILALKVPSISEGKVFKSRDVPKTKKGPGHLPDTILYSVFTWNTL